jgi:hypothetical protein
LTISHQPSWVGNFGGREGEEGDGPVEGPQGVVKVEDDEAGEHLEEAQDLQRLRLHPLVAHRRSPLLAAATATRRREERLGGETAPARTWTALVRQGKSATKNANTPSLDASSESAKRVDCSEILLGLDQAASRTVGLGLGWIAPCPRADQQRPNRLFCGSAFPHRKTTTSSGARRCYPSPCASAAASGSLLFAQIQRALLSCHTVHSTRFRSQRWGSRCTRRSPAPRVRSGAESVKEEAERKYGGFPDLLATGEVDLPAARSGEPGSSGFAVCFAMLWHGLEPVLAF